MAPPIKVDYAKSARSRCTLKECSKIIEKGELRIGSGAMMPGASEYSYKWRHICCFTARQINNMNNNIDNVEGFCDLSEEHQEVLRRMVKSELVGDMSNIGKFISLSGGCGAEAAVKGAKAKKIKEEKADSSNDNTNSSSQPSSSKPATEAGVKRPRSKGPMGSAVTTDGSKVDTAMDSDATDEYDVEVTTEQPLCPYGSQCFRTSSQHFIDYRHPDSFERTGVSIDSTEKVRPAAYVVVKAVRKGSSSSTTSNGGSKWESQTAINNPKAGENDKLVEQGNLSQGQHDSSTNVVKHTPDTSALRVINNNKRNPCPFGLMCIRKDAKHMEEFLH